MGISIIMPAYNAAATLDSAVQSVLAQSLTEWELIIIDDHSADDTLTRARAYTDSRIRVLQTPANQGAAAARQLGTQAARYDWLNYLDADDRLTPDALAALLQAAQTNPQAGLVYAGYSRINAEGKRYGTRRFLHRWPRPNGHVLPAFLQQNRLVNGGLALARRDLVLQSGGWPVELRTSSDWALWCLLAALAPVHYVSGLIALEYRELPTGITQTRHTALEHVMPAIDFVFAHPLIRARLTPHQLARLRQRKLAQAQTLLAAHALRRRQYQPAFAHLKAALKQDWRHSPRALAQCALAGLDGWV